MGTRCLTIVKDENNQTLVNLYRQYDGYPTGHGKELVNFLKKIRITHGLADDRKNTANGIQCLAAQIVAHFKNEAGHFYLCPPDCRDIDEEYIYEISINAVKNYKDIIFDGDVKDYVPKD